MRDPYEVLGVGRHASQAEIKSAFRRLAVRHHPDRNPNDPNAQVRFQELNQAHQILSDPDKRAVRTALLTRRASPGQERVIKAMREWNVRLDEAFFVGDLPREQALEAFRAHLFFEDGATHFRVPEQIVKMDLRATHEEAAATSQSPFSRLRLRSSD